MTTNTALRTVRRRNHLLASFAIVLVLIGTIVFCAYYFLHNYAEDVAKPIEKSLVANGAVKKCSLGDPGRGPDNDSPWYTVYFELPKDRAEAETLVRGISEENGYRLAQTKAGAIGSIDDLVFIDYTSKKSSGPGLADSPIKLKFALTNDGPFRVCLRSGEVFSDATHTAVSLEVKLPRFGQ